MNQEAPLATQQESGPLPWQRGWRTFKSVWPQLLYISAATIAIPQYLFYWAESLRAARLGQSFGLDTVQGLSPLLDIVKNFSLQYAALTIVLTFLATLGYFSIIIVTIQSDQGQPLHTLRAIQSGIKVFFPRRWTNIPLLIGVVTATAMILFIAPSLGIVGQYIAISLLVLLTGLPVLLAHSPASFSDALRGALSLGYAKNSGITRWSAFFVLLTYQMALIGLVSLIKHGQEWLLSLDLSLQLQRSLWFQVAPYWPFGALPLLLEALVNLLLAVLMGVFAVFSASFILDLKQRQQAMPAPKPGYAARPDAP